ncbi:hypothetical protein PsorP6_000605 [Peronosclerospora sorghi]|uniref:Uncharacterized protein n=1 Tax=Peronosclerospora sorghi TaxID=230839 RepID=A0ACC0WW47_9STRA|nr:hypothetical protein PsorP6_000605 [Peronosclerospora sorghi]
MLLAYFGYEWVGVLEQWHLLHEALELTFRCDTTSDMAIKINVNGSVPQSCARVFRWFYSFNYSVSADKIAAQLMTMSTELQLNRLAEDENALLGSVNVLIDDLRAIENVPSGAFTASSDEFIGRSSAAYPSSMAFDVADKATLNPSLVSHSQ